MWAQWAQTRTRCADGPFKARNGPAGANWEGGTSGKPAPEAGVFPQNSPVATRKVPAILVQRFPSVRPTRCISEVNVVADELTQTQVLGKGDRKEQPGIAHQAVVVEGDSDSVGLAEC